MITVEFNGFDDMIDFAKRLVGTSAATPKEVSVQSVQATPVTTVTPATQATTISSVQTSIPVQTTQVPVTPPVQTTTQNYTLDDLARAAMTIMDSGRQGELVGLLSQFGIEALPALPQAQYGAFATALRGMGAKI